MLGVNYGYQYMKSAESLDIRLIIFRTRFQSGAMNFFLSISMLFGNGIFNVIFLCLGKFYIMT